MGKGILFLIIAAFLCIYIFSKDKKAKYKIYTVKSANENEL